MVMDGLWLFFNIITSILHPHVGGHNHLLLAGKNQPVKKGSINSKCSTLWTFSSNQSARFDTWDWQGCCISRRRLGTNALDPPRNSMQFHTHPWATISGSKMKQVWFCRNIFMSKSEILFHPFASVSWCSPSKPENDTPWNTRRAATGPCRQSRSDQTGSLTQRRQPDIWGIAPRKSLEIGGSVWKHEEFWGSDNMWYSTQILLPYNSGKIADHLCEYRDKDVYWCVFSKGMAARSSSWSSTTAAWCYSSPLTTIISKIVLWHKHLYYSILLVYNMMPNL